VKGIPVILHVRTKVGLDALNNPIYEDSTVTVENCLPGEPTADDYNDAATLYGKTIAYMLGIPKGDTHDWEDTTVEFFGQSFRTFGKTIQGIEALVPTPWHRKIRCERYE